MTTTPYEGWSVLELMGHRLRPGYVREVEVAATKMMRVDMPVGKDEAGNDIIVTEFYTGGAIYALRPCSEEVARAELKYVGDPRPVRPLEFKERPAPKQVTHDTLGDVIDKALDRGEGAQESDDDPERPF